MKWFYTQYYSLYVRWIYVYHNRFKNQGRSLRTVLEKSGKTRWLDMGSSGKFTESFHFADLYPRSEAKEELKDRYFQFNATKPISDELLAEMGKFDLIRMQHVFEHFTPEDSRAALENCAKLLNPGGYILISVPDLKIFVERYRHNCLDVAWDFKDWAESRIEKGSPQSFYFSIFSHSVLYQSHLWCYDREGLEYALKRTGLFTEITHISVFDALANIPFTHNRPWEDVVVMARKA